MTHEEDGAIRQSATPQGRIIIFIMETERDEDGQYIPCIAEEGVYGYSRTDWRWGTDLDQAREFANNRNERMGIGLKEATLIQISTMRREKK